MTTNGYEFSEWIENEIAKKGWTKSDLARYARLDKGAITRIINRERKPTPETLLAIAKALNKPPEEIYRVAGILPEKNEDDPLTAEAEYLLSQLPENKRQQAIAFIRFLADRKEENHNAANAPLGEIE